MFLIDIVFFHLYMYIYRNALYKWAQFPTISNVHELCFSSPEPGCPLVQARLLRTLLDLWLTWRYLFRFVSYSCLVKPGLATFLLTTIPCIVILAVNTTLYLLTWFHIRRDAQRIKSIIGTQAQSGTAYIQAAKTMTLFITVFTVQWWAVAVYGIWQIVTDDVPPLVYIFVVVFTNIGGCLNLVVYLSILKKRRRTMAVGTLLPTSRPRDQNPYQVKTSDKEKAQSSTAKQEAHSTGQASLWTTNECSIHEPSLALTLQWMFSTRVKPRSDPPMNAQHTGAASFWHTNRQQA